MTATAFRALHHADRPLVLPNVWDAVSARVFADAGFPALATASMAVSAVLGYADQEQTPADEMFAAVWRIARAVDVPVSADIEAGYGLPADQLVERLLAAGVVGCNLEDTNPATGQLVDPESQAERLAAVRAAAGEDLVINARVDTFLHRGTVDDAITRGRHYVEAGADCVYPIFAPVETLQHLADSIAAPINAHHRQDGPSPTTLASLGATRITFGGNLLAQSKSHLESLATTLHT